MSKTTTGDGSTHGNGQSLAAIASHAEDEPSSSKSVERLDRRVHNNRLCEYSDSEDSDHENRSRDAESTSSSPKKRRRALSVSGENIESYPLDERGNVDVSAIFETASFEETLAFLTDNFKRSCPKFEALNATSVEVFLSDNVRKRSLAVALDSSNHSSPLEGANLVDPAIPSTSSGDSFRAPKWRNRKFLFKPFVRQANGALEHDERAAAVEVIIPEQLAASYGLYIWPSAPVLSWYIWLNQEDFVGKVVLELGAGTSLPGLLSAKIGAAKVYLTDCASNKDVLNNCREAVRLNGLERTARVVGLTWGLFGSDAFQLSDNVDYIIGSDLFFDPDVFETLCATIALLLQLHPRAAVLVSVQERSEDWTVEEFLLKWQLRARYIYPREFLRGTGIEEDNLTGKHKIYIIEISKAGV